MEPKDFRRRSYRYENDNGKPIGSGRAEVKVLVNGGELIRIALRDPGMLSIVARPDAPGTLDVEIVEAASSKFRDHRAPSDISDNLTEWQQLAMFGDRQ